MSDSHQSRGAFFAVYRQRVRYANLRVKKDGVLERLNPSWSNLILDASNSRHVRTFSRYRCPLQTPACLEFDAEKEVLTLHISTDRTMERREPQYHLRRYRGRPFHKAIRSVKPISAPTTTTTTTPSEISQGSMKRTFEDIDADEDELDQEEERIIARRKQLREERKQLRGSQL